MIEFACPHCQKTLKTTDDKAGAQAACPGCGELVLVPSLAGSTLAGATRAGSTSPAGEQASVEQPGNEPTADRPATAPFPQTGAAVDDTKACPMCGEMIKRAATRCRYCGEELEGPAVGPLLPTKISMGDVVDQSWRIFKSQMGLCVGVALLYAFLQYAGGIALQLLLAAFTGRNQPEFLSAVLGLGVGIGSNIWSLFLTLGVYRFMLKLTRGQKATPGDLFSGGQFLVPGFVSGVLTSILIMLGFVLLIVPGIYLSLALSQILYIIVDQRCGPIEALTRSWELTRGNLLAILGLVLAAMAILLLGLLAACIGLVFAWPLIMLMQAVTYLRITGQPVTQVP